MIMTIPMTQKFRNWLMTAPLPPRYLEYFTSMGYDENGKEIPVTEERLLWGERVATQRAQLARSQLGDQDDPFMRIWGEARGDTRVYEVWCTHPTHTQVPAELWEAFRVWVRSEYPEAYAKLKERM